MDFRKFPQTYTRGFSSGSYSFTDEPYLYNRTLTITKYI